jgi:hypothetical protein
MKAGRWEDRDRTKRGAARGTANFTAPPSDSFVLGRLFLGQLLFPFRSRRVRRGSPAFARVPQFVRTLLVNYTASTLIYYLILSELSIMARIPANDTIMTVELAA